MHRHFHYNLNEENWSATIPTGRKTIIIYNPFAGKLGPTGLKRLSRAAEILRDRLRVMGFEVFLRTTGGKGLHLVMALAGGDGWPVVKGFAEAFARAMAADAPGLFTAELDCSENAPADSGQDKVICPPAALTVSVGNCTFGSGATGSSG